MATPEASQYIDHTRGGPPGRVRRRSLVRLLDERDPAGGAAKAAVFLLHPGPSLLVTAVTVGAAAMALHATPSGGLALRLVLLMLPAQFAIGAANDLADLGADRLAKAHKPLVRGVVPVWLAVAVVLLGVGVSLWAASTLGGWVLLATAVGLGAGLAYDVGVKRGVASWVPWWVAFTALPLCAFTAAERFTAALWWVVPVTGLLAVGLHCANALPDLDDDRRAGVRSLPVLLGSRRARVLALGAVAGAVVATAALALPLHQAGPWLPLAWGVVAVCLVAAVAWRRVARAPFPVLALATAALAVAWLAALPVAAAPAP
jgi:4-hydroxybenzoate polyprenyltransferase